MTLSIFLTTLAVALAAALPAAAQFSDNSGGIPAQGSTCDPNSSQYNAAECTANPLGATAVATIHIERSRPDLPQGEVAPSDTQPDPLPGSDEP